MTDQNQPTGKRRRFHPFSYQPQRETPAERKLREAIQDGDSTHLPNAGKPLNLQHDPNVPDDRRLAYKILKDADMAPEWIERGKVLRHDLKKLKGMISRAVREYDRAYAAAEIAPGNQGAQLRQNARQKWNASKRKLATKAADYNREVMNYNLSVPPGIPHKHFFDFEAEVEKQLRGG
jgi:hypothetical protein